MKLLQFHYISFFTIKVFLGLKRKLRFEFLSAASSCCVISTLITSSMVKFKFMQKNRARVFDLSLSRQLSTYSQMFGWRFIKNIPCIRNWFPKSANYNELSRQSNSFFYRTIIFVPSIKISNGSFCSDSKIRVHKDSISSLHSKADSQNCAKNINFHSSGYSNSFFLITAGFIFFIKASTQSVPFHVDSII